MIFFFVIAVGEFYGGFVGSVYLTDFLCVCVWLLLEYCTIRYVVLKFFCGVMVRLFWCMLEYLIFRCDYWVRSVSMYLTLGVFEFLIFIRLVDPKFSTKFLVGFNIIILG